MDVEAPVPARRRRALLAALAVLSLLPAAEVAGQSRPDAQTPLARIDDLRALSTQVRHGQQPLLLFFSLPGCPYCLEVRRGYLAQMAGDGKQGPLIREIEISSRRAFVGLDGRSLTEADLAGLYGVRMVPHVELVDAEMKPLGEPLIGIGVPDFYGAYLAAAIDGATRRLREK